jgi:hypothetical protein
MLDAYKLTDLAGTLSAVKDNLWMNHARTMHSGKRDISSRRTLIPTRKSGTVDHSRSFVIRNRYIALVTVEVGILIYIFSKILEAN